MKSIYVEMNVTSPLHHSEFGRGGSNAVGVRRFPVLTPNGDRTPVAVVSGNALRGRMRRLVMRELLDRCGFAIGADGYDRIYAAVANGGHLTGGDAMVDPAALRQMRADCPPLSLFGSALYRYMLPGRMSVGICWPVCDVTVAAGLARPLTAVVPNSANLESLSSLSRLPEKERQNTEATGVAPLPVTLEVIDAGATLSSEIRLYPESTDLEASCAAWALDRVESLGGKATMGLGRVRVSHDGDAAAYAEWLAGDLGQAKAVLEAI